MDDTPSVRSSLGSKIIGVLKYTVVLLVGGVLEPAVQNAIEHKFHITDLSIYVTAFGFLVLTGLAVWLYEVIAKETRLLMRKVGTVKYVDDPVDDTVNSGDANEVYAELTNVVCAAKSEILALSLSAIGDRDFSPNNASVRENYFNSILKRVESGRENFRYARILQIPNERWNEDLKATIGSMMMQHAEKALRLASTFRPARNVTLKKIKTQRLTGFVVVDRKTLIIVIGGITDLGHPYHKGLFVFERPEGDPLIEKYINYFEFLNGHQNTLPLLNAVP